ncbi:MAG: alpha-amylase [Cyclobacteriaceae bacterium]|jgi:alpha-amylase
MDICFIFNFSAESHLNEYSFFDIGRNHQYFDDKATEKAFLNNFYKKQLPLLEFIIDCSKRKDNKFSLYFSGTFLELLSSRYPELIIKLKKLFDNDQMELLGGTYDDSVSSLFSIDVFKATVKKHKNLIESTFGHTPVNFTNSVNIYSDALSGVIKDLNFKSTLVPMIDWFVGSRSAKQAYLSSDQKLTLLLSDYKAADYMINSKDSISLLRDKSLSDRLVVSQVDPLKTVFKRELIAVLNSLKTRKSRFLTISQGISDHGTKEIYHMPETVALNTSGRDLSYFIGNPLQQEVLEKMKTIKSQILPKKDDSIMIDLIKLSTSDNFLLMSTNNEDGEISKPYDCYLQMMNMLADLEIRLYRYKIS